MRKIVDRRYWWLRFSLLFIAAGALFLGLFGLRSGIDFSGGALWEIQFLERQSSQLNTERIAQIFEGVGFSESRVQVTEASSDTGAVGSALIRTRQLSASEPEAQQRQALDLLQQEYGPVQLISLQSVGETVSSESRLYAVFAVLGASVAILLYLTLAFRKVPHPIRYGICTILAMLHDVAIVIGVAAILGYVIGLEVDALFLTAVLTTISFSVQDKIVVFDRIRENLSERRLGMNFTDLVNLSIAQVMPRSICTQMTSFLTLTALLLFGGATINNFVLVLMIGLLCGTYSSMFIAAPLLVIWENREWETWFGRRTEEPSPA
jgi:preprotein translocase subunit SecF